MGKHRFISRSGRELSPGKMVGSADGYAADLRREFWRKSGCKYVTRTGGARARQCQAHYRDQSIMRLFLVLLLLAGIAGLAGCQTEPSSHARVSGTVPQLETASAAAAGLSPADASTAKALYVAKCARCHKFYDPAQYDQA